MSCYDVYHGLIKNQIKYLVTILMKTARPKSMVTPT